MRKVVVLGGQSEGYAYEIAALSCFSDVEFVVFPSTKKEDALAVVQDAEVILFTATQIDAELIDKMKKCKLIIRYGIGYDNVDCAYAASRGIYVCNAPNYGVIDVAEHALSLIYATAKKTVRTHERALNGSWGPGKLGRFVRLAQKKIGFIGFGNIGQAVCQRTNAMEMQALVYDPYVSVETLEKYGARSVTLDELLAESDIITLHLPLNANTKYIINADAFKKMKNSAILINTSRGAIVNEKDLISALENGEIAAAGLDVFEDETKKLDDRLLSAENAVLTPHVAWNTADSLLSLHREVGDNIVRYFMGKKPNSIVNGL